MGDGEWGSFQVYHPNIDLDGNVCLNILREDWKPVLSVNAIIYGLQYLFLVRFHNLILKSSESIPRNIHVEMLHAYATY